MPAWSTTSPGTGRTTSCAWTSRSTMRCLPIGRHYLSTSALYSKSARCRKQHVRELLACKMSLFYKLHAQPVPTLLPSLMLTL